LTRRPSLRTAAHRRSLTSVIYRYIELLQETVLDRTSFFGSHVISGERAKKLRKPNRRPQPV
jgi:hypothetical protein